MKFTTEYVVQQVYKTNGSSIQVVPPPPGPATPPLGDTLAGRYVTPVGSSVTGDLVFTRVNTSLVDGYVIGLGSLYSKVDVCGRQVELYASYINKTDPANNQIVEFKAQVTSAIVDGRKRDGYIEVAVIGGGTAYQVTTVLCPVAFAGSH